jgi:hypothetical protein
MRLARSNAGMIANKRRAEARLFYLAKPGRKHAKVEMTQQMKAINADKRLLIR